MGTNNLYLMIINNERIGLGEWDERRSPETESTPYPSSSPWLPFSKAQVVTVQSIYQKSFSVQQHPHNYLIGLWTVTNFVPSGKVASTCTSGIISGIPSITSSLLNRVIP